MSSLKLPSSPFNSPPPPIKRTPLQNRDLGGAAASAAAERFSPNNWSPSGKPISPSRVRILPSDKENKTVRKLLFDSENSVDALSSHIEDSKSDPQTPEKFRSPSSSPTKSTPSRHSALHRRSPSRSPKVHRHSDISRLFPSSPSVSLPLSEEKKIHRSIRSLLQKQSPQRKEKSTALFRKFAKTLSVHSPSKPIFHRDAARIKASNWAREVHHALHLVNPDQVPRNIFDLSHIEKRHLYENGDLVHYKNPQTLVQSGSKKGVSATFFPESIRSDEQIMELVNQAELAAHSNDNRELYRTNSETPYYIELIRNLGLIITAYPIYFCVAYKPDCEWRISEDQSLTSKQALHCAIESLKNRTPIRYEMDDQVVIDIGEPCSQLLPLEPPLSCGVYLIVEKALLPQNFLKKNLEQ